MAKKKKTTTAQTPQEQALRALFPDKSIFNAAQGALNLYNMYATPEWVEGNNFNYKLPTTASDPYLAKLQADAMRPEGERSPDAETALDLFRLQAKQGEFVGPELMEAFNNARTIAMGGEGPAMTAQRDVLARSLNSGLQTALRQGRIGAMAGGVRGGGEAAIANPAIRDFGRQYSNGIQGIQLGNLAAYQNLAGQVDQERFNRRNIAYNSYNQAVQGREAFEAQRYNDRLGRYNSLQQQNLDRYYQLQGADQQRRDAFMGGRLQAPFLGGSVGEQREGRKLAAKYGQQAISSAQSYQVPSFGGHSTGREVMQRPA